MSRSKPNKVFAIVNDQGGVRAHVIARHGKGALMIAKNHGVCRSGYEAREVGQEFAKVALNKGETK